VWREESVIQKQTIPEMNQGSDNMEEQVIYENMEKQMKEEGGKTLNSKENIEEEATGSRF